MKTIGILGSTGSIGTQALEVARYHNIKVKAIAANTNVTLMEKQAREFQVEYVAAADIEAAKDLKVRLSDTNVKVLSGKEGVLTIAQLDSMDVLLNAMVGIAGLQPTVMALQHKIPVALANKETLVAGGNLVMQTAKEQNIPILPVDSEHSAIFQCLRGNQLRELKRIFLTASGGPFYGKTKKDLQNVTIEDALHHPNWSMGAKVTIDSATLMNKGLEFIEAKWLFDLMPEQIEVVIHRQSIVHSAVEYADHSVIAQLGMPDMKVPIQYALLYPERLPCPVKSLSLIDCGTLTFEKPDNLNFVCLQQCIQAIQKGGNVPIIVNAANEIAVEAFLNRRISFLRIGELVRKAVEALPFQTISNISDIWNVDQAAREYVLSKL